jgi:outer membrane protein with beta-barrel domain
MYDRSVYRARSSKRATALACLVVMTLLISRARADGSLGAYAGASVGPSTVKADPLEFSQHDRGWKVLVGIRPLTLLGAEITYTDFGYPNYSQGVPGGLNASVRASSAEALGLVYLPLPVPLLDVYGKGGVARLNYRARSSNGCLACNHFNADHTETRVAYGGGAQLKFDRLAVRIEYDRISAIDGDPSLLSVGITWSF